VNYNIYITITFTGGHLDAITLVLYDYIYRKENLHSMFKNGYDSDSIIRNGKSNLDHDLYNEDETVIILKHISDYIFKRKVKVLCPCHYKEDCFLLKMVYHTFNYTILLIINTIMLYIGY